MARPKKDATEKSLQICLQTALYRAVQKCGEKQIVVEKTLKLTNSKEDGAVWRKFGRGVHPVSEEKLHQMILDAEREGWCNPTEIYAQTQDLLEARDAGIIEQRMDNWIAQIEDMAILCRFGSIDNQNKIVYALKEALRVIES